MGTTKRERQRANRDAKRAVEAKAARIASVKATAIRVAKVAVSFAVVIGLITIFTGNDAASVTTTTVITTTTTSGS